MNSVPIAYVPGIPALLFALFLTPFLLVRRARPSAPLPAALAAAGIVSLLLNTLLPLALHMAGAPIDRVNLMLAHLPLALLALLGFATGKHPFLPERKPEENGLLLLCAAFAATVIPFTALAGIDTYKWLDLAGAVRAEKSIPWLVHPFSLLGFTGRSYPSAQPLALASAWILGELGADGSYYAVSALFGTLGIASAYLLGEAFHESRRGGLWMAFLYGFSPVFVRYNHWATGRGLLLALLPLFLLAVLRLPKPRAIALLLLTGILLPLSHKTGLAASAGILSTLPAALLIPRRGCRVVLPLLALAAAAAAVLLAPNVGLPFPAGKAVGCARMGLVRFGWLLPLAAAGLFLAPNRLCASARRRLVPAAIASFPFACSSDAYGALIALVFLALAASAGILGLQARHPAARGASRAHAAAAIFLLALGAAVILLNRSLTATPRRIKQAALFLDRYDPQGPYTIECTPWRPQMQGYVAGCPRFSIARTGPVRLVFHPPPALRGPPRKVLARWTSHARHLFSVTGYSLDYYGKNPRRYYVAIDGRGNRPANAERIYDMNGVAVFKPNGQSVPERRPELGHE